MIFVEGLSAPETPRLTSNNNWMCVEMNSGHITWISRDGKKKRNIAKTNRPNGLVVDKKHNIWVAESYPQPALLKVNISGQVEVIMDSCLGDPFLFPNDLCFGPDHALYMTDSGLYYEDWFKNNKLKEDWQKLPFNGCVYRIDLDINP